MLPLPLHILPLPLCMLPLPLLSPYLCVYPVRSEKLEERSNKLVQLLIRYIDTNAFCTAHQHKREDTDDTSGSTDVHNYSTHPM